MKTESFISWEYSELEECYIIAMLWVAPEDRRKGVGSKLVIDALSEMREAGKADTVKLCADSDLIDSEDPIELVDLVTFYENQGFVVEMCDPVVIMSNCI